MKTRKELKKDNHIIAIIGIIGILFFALLSIYFVFEKDILEKQLSLCQDKVPIWTLKISCQDIDLPIFFDAYVRVNITDIGFNLSAEFENYEDYQDALNSFKELNEYCEVLE